MKNNRRNTVASIVLGTALMGTASFAGMTGSCGGNMKKAETKTMKKGSCGASMNKKAAAMTGKAGKSTGSCGAGKCGGNMKKVVKKAAKKAKGSCGVGKCGSM